MRLTVNGLDQEIVYDRHAIEDLLAPRLEAWIAGTADAKRHFAFLAAPPGTGKSTLALLLERHFGGALQSIGIDGFHYPRSVLAAGTTVTDGHEVSLASVKGAPETFDVAALEARLARGRRHDVVWPIYDRQRHDVVADGIPVTARHILLEGNWLLLDEAPWVSLRRHADVTIFIQAPETLLRERLINRKVLGGMDRADAEAFYLRSDGVNVRRALMHSITSSVDLLLTMDADGLFHESEQS